jgi:signal transduction histidine kinase
MVLADPDLARKKTVAVWGGTAAVVVLIVLAIGGAIIKGKSAMSLAELFEVGFLGAVFLGLNLWSSLIAVRAALAPAGLRPADANWTWKIRFYFFVQLALATLILLTASPAHAMGMLWLILLPPVGHSVMFLSRWGIGLVALACISIFTAYLAWMYGRPGLIPSVLTFVFAVIFTLVFTQIAVSADRSRSEMARMAAELREYAFQAGELATVRERNRLAREIHDSLGHYLTVVNVQIEAARVVMDRDRARALDALEKAQALTREGLQEIRRSVAALRTSPLDGRSLPDALRLVAGESNGGGFSVDFQLKGDPRAVSPQAELTLLRASQEGITNARKHALAAKVGLVLDFGVAGKVALSVKDDGQGAVDTDRGFGLLGLRERAQTLGGEVRVRTSPGHGFTLEVEVPG